MDYEPRYNPIHQSLLHVKMIAGVDVRFVVPLWALTLSFVFVLHYFSILFVGIIAHMFFAWLFKLDPKMTDVYMAYTKEAITYDPWPHITSKTKRPKGFDHDLLR